MVAQSAAECNQVLCQFRTIGGYLLYAPSAIVVMREFRKSLYTRKGVLMSTVIYRPDYAKFVMDLPRGLFSTYYQRFCELSHECKFSGDFLRSHKVTALYNQNIDRETTILEVWGEWAGIVRLLPSTWGAYLKRFDARAIVWDADKEAVLAVGQRFQRSSVGYNVEVFNSKPASKRLGRDRGGVGFRLGSRKSDLCIVVYKRATEPVAQEVRLSGQILRTAVGFSLGAIDGTADTRSFWSQLLDRAAFWGQRRLSRCLDRAGIGVYWPTFVHDRKDEWDSLQTSFAPVVPQTTEPEDDRLWSNDEQPE